MVSILTVYYYSCAHITRTTCSSSIQTSYRYLPVGGVGLDNSEGWGGNYRTAIFRTMGNEVTHLLWPYKYF